MKLPNFDFSLGDFSVLQRFIEGNSVMALANSSGFVFLFYLVLLIKAADSKCEKSFNCGFLGSVEFPLSDNPECGLVMVNCSLSPPSIQLKAGGPSYVIDQKISTNKFLVYDPYLDRQLMNDSHHCHSIQNRSLPDLPYISFAISPNITILSCNKSLDPNDRGRIQGYFANYTSYTACENFDFYYADPPHASPEEESSIPEHCSIVLMPVKPDYDQSQGDLFQLFYPQFNLEWHVSADCLSCHSGGECPLNSNNEFRCQGRGKTTHEKKILLIGGVATIALISTSIVLFLAIWRKFTTHKLTRHQKETTETRSTIELYLKNNGNLAPRRYKYSDLKKMTKSFHEKLGKGGYGSVYKGKLPDGRLVAVKILSEVRGNGEEFMNEVTSISRTSHVNIVTLLGYCFEGSKRALIYEFMPNGSLENFIRNNATSLGAKDGLGWEKLLDIAVGTARGLEYLHQGCNIRILHFNIKPHNILLDKDMNPKISDFGLAKLCPNRSSIVSMLVARGTIGYIAPEIFCRNFGEVSHKSDVYSYGMMVLEMALGRQNLGRQVDQSSEMYFPNWIYKHLEANVMTGLDPITNADEWEIAKKMIIVGLWCIQTEPRNRPSISKVVEMLIGSLDFLEIPPWPYLSSPPRPAPDVSSASERSAIQHNSLLPYLSSPGDGRDN